MFVMNSASLDRLDFRKGMMEELDPVRIRMLLEDTTVPATNNTIVKKKRITATATTILLLLLLLIAWQSVISLSGLPLAAPGVVSLVILRSRTSVVSQASWG